METRHAESSGGARERATLLEMFLESPYGAVSVLGRKGEATRSHASMLEDAARAAGGLLERGLIPGSRVGIVAEPSHGFIVDALSLWWLGCSIVLLALPRKGRSRAMWVADVTRQMEAAHATAVIGSVVTAGEGGSLPILEQRLSGPIDVVQRDAADEAMIAFTSGTTGEPRGVVLSHGALVERTLSHAESRGCCDPNVDHRLGWMPLHQWALFGDVFYPMAFGVPSTLLPTASFMADPSAWLRELSLCRVTHSVAPNHAYGVAARQIEIGAVPDIDLSAWKVAGVAGEVVDPGTVERFIARAEPRGFNPAAITPSYGLTETGGVCGRRSISGIRIENVDADALGNGVASVAQEPGASFVCLGKPQARVDVQIFDDSGSALLERRIGEVGVTGRTLMDEYLDEPDETSARFRGPWFMTGDLGYMADGELFITGRKKDLIIIGGRNLIPSDIERVILESATGVDGCAAVTVRGKTTEELVILVEITDADSGEHDKLISGISRSVWQAIGVAPAVVRVLPASSLPRTDSGEISRAGAREHYADGRL